MSTSGQPDINNAYPLKEKTMENEKGMVLVLAIFMLALLSMIGLSSMMTSTTDINIAGNDKFSKIVYYQAESGLTIAAEVIEKLQEFPAFDDNEYFDVGETIKIPDGSFMQEGTTSNENMVWTPDNQTETVAGNPDIQLSGDLSINVDVDKLGAKRLAGGGAEFASGDQGIGVNAYKILFNIQSVGTLPGNRNIKANHIMGYDFIPKM